MMDEQFEDLEKDGLEDDPVAKTYARDSLEDVTSDDYDDPSDRLSRLDTVGGLSSRILAGGATSDLWDGVYERDAVEEPASEEHAWEAAGSISHNPFRTAASDDFSMRILGDADEEGWTGQGNSATPTGGEQQAVSASRRLPYPGPYKLNQKQVVISRWSNKVQKLTPNGSELEVSPDYLPPICVSTGKKVPPLGAAIDHQANPHSIRQKLVYFPRRRRYLWACVYIIVLLCSLAMAKAFLGEGVEPVSTSEDRIWRILKVGPESLVSAKIMAGLGILLFLAAAYTFYSAFSKRITCNMTVGFSSGWPRYKRTSFFIVGSLIAVFGIAIFYLTYGVPFLWVLRNYANPGILVTTFGLWVCWSAWHPLKCVKIGDEFIRFEGGALLSGQLPKQLFAEMDRCPREVANRIRDDEELDRVAEEKSDEGLVAGLVKAAVPESLIFTAKESRKRKIKRELESQKKRDRQKQVDDWKRIDSEMKGDASSVDEEDESSFDEEDSTEADEVVLESEHVKIGHDEVDESSFDEQGSTGVDEVVLESEDVKISHEEVDERSFDEQDEVHAGKVLTEEIARQYLQDQDGTPLWEYKSLDARGARVLAEYEGLLYLCVTHLSPQAAAGLAHHRDTLCLSDLKRLPVDVARELAEHQGGSLWLDSLTTLSANEAERLAQYKGRLHLDGLTELSFEVADALGRQPGRLSLTGLTKLSVKAGKALLQTEEVIELNGLTELSLELAEILARHKGGLDLDGLTSLSLDVALALAKTQGDLELDGLTELTLDVAKALAQHQHQLSLDGLQELSPELAGVLSRHTGHLDLGLKKIDRDVALALRQYQGEYLTLWDLEEIEEDVARILKSPNTHVLVDKEKLPSPVVAILD